MGHPFPGLRKIPHLKIEMWGTLSLGTGFEKLYCETPLESVRVVSIGGLEAAFRK
jgi:hypothetical protein